MKRFLIILMVTIASFGKLSAQANIISTNTVAEQVMLGAYNPTLFLASNIINHPDSISKGINARVNPDSLHAYLVALKNFKNRNTGSDTISLVRGIGAARKWVYKKFQQFSLVNENRLLPSYLKFNLTLCGITSHKNVFAVLPGTDTSDKSIILIEGHMDSRCAGLCDTACIAEGMEDNGSGTALVIELARVMSKYSYKRTIVFMTTISEEQGLNGAEAFADYVQSKGIKMHGVLNNDVIGGVICGVTSSPPSCSGVGSIDSTHVRLFSFGTFNSFHKQLARFVKLEYKELIKPIALVTTTIHIMTPEDRTGRGGDHIPFRQHNYSAIRFTSANEHGDASLGTGYTDRQHTSSDILGVDTDADLIIDSFFVDFNYLARNAVINGNAAGMMGIGPLTPDFTLTSTGNNLIVNILTQQQYLKYRIGVRTLTNDWDSVYTFSGATSHTISNLNPANYIVSVASVDAKNVESLFSKELQNSIISGLMHPDANGKSVELLQNKPNPSDEATTISVLVNKDMSHKEAYILIKDLQGKEVLKTRITLEMGMNEINYDHGYHKSGTYIYSLIIDEKIVQSKQMVFTN
ncbi:MAG: M28 family peptidase [Bacteroidota bacterium]|nr:M28 family peptidase [Bacteroidota bacterium]